MRKFILVVLLFTVTACLMEPSKVVPTSSLAATNVLPPTLTQAPIRRNTKMPVFTPTANETNQPSHPVITGISVSPAQRVLAPGGGSINLVDNLSALADEHSSILPPGIVPGHKDYLFFVNEVLTGNSGPDANG